MNIYVGCDSENCWTMSRALMVDSNENEHLTNGRNRRILSPQLSLSHTGHLHWETRHLHSSGVLSICIALHLYCLSIQCNVRQILTSAEGTSRAFELWTTMLIKDLWKTFHSSAISYKCSMTKFTPSVRYFVHQFPRHDNANVNWAI